MPQIRFYAPTGVNYVFLPDGIPHPVIDGYITADSKYASELLKAGFTPATEDYVQMKNIRLALDVDKTLTHGTGKVYLPWGYSDFDYTEGAWNVGTPTRITVPPGFGWARISCQLNILTPPVNGQLNVHIEKNGLTSYAGMGVQIGANNTAGANMSVQAVSEWQPVNAGDFFQVYSINTDPTTDYVVQEVGRTWLYAEFRQ